MQIESELVNKIILWHKKGLKPLVVTVINTWGSAPRPKGSMMILADGGHCWGSVSGGCVETDLVDRYGHFFDKSYHLPHVETYGDGKNTHIKLPCGGKLELLIEAIKEVKDWQTILRGLEKGQILVRELKLNNGIPFVSDCTPDEQFYFGEESVRQVFGLQWHMLIIGAGELSCQVAQMAVSMGYQVQICDPRNDYEKIEDHSITYVTDMPDDAVLRLNYPERSIVLTLSHDPKLDDMALMVALDVNFFYVGALGSRRSSEARRARLLELEVAKDKIDSLHAPVGLPLGGRTPAEIALSILAEITALRHNVRMQKVYGI